MPTKISTNATTPMENHFSVLNNFLSIANFFSQILLSKQFAASKSSRNSHPQHTMYIQVLSGKQQITNTRPNRDHRGERTIKILLQSISTSFRNRGIIPISQRCRSINFSCSTTQTGNILLSKMDRCFGIAGFELFIGFSLSYQFFSFRQLPVMD